MNERERLRKISIFMLNVIKTDHCWFWKGSVRPDGYGSSGIRGVTQTAHRTAWILMRGPIAAGLVVCHTCDNRRCVNPAHLYIGTVMQNVRDAWNRDRYPARTGTRNGHAKLTEGDVLMMRADRETSHAEYARRFAITREAIRYARIGRTWPHLSDTPR